MSRLTRDETTEPISRDQNLRRGQGQGNVHFPCSADHERDWQPYPVDPYSAICDDHTLHYKTLRMRNSSTFKVSLEGSIAYVPLCVPVFGVSLHGDKCVVSVQYNGGFLPDFLLLTLSDDHHGGIRLNLMETFRSNSILCCQKNASKQYFPLTVWIVERLRFGCVQFFRGHEKPH